ncbi:MAG: class I SAM-dependent methyltransferase [Acidobacteriota bacterium]
MAHQSHLEAKELFDQTVDSYQQAASGQVHDFRSLLFQRRIAIVEELIESVPPGGQVLDFGMGPAVFAQTCLDWGFSYLGIDIAPKMVEQARALGLEGAEFEVGDLESLSERKASSDLTLAVGLIDYLEELPAGLGALAETVKPGGHLIVSFRNRHSVPRVLRDSAKVVLRPVAGEGSTKAFFSQAHEKAFDFGIHLKPLLKQKGFGNFQVRYFNCSPLFFSFPMPPWLWERWFAVDGVLASPLTRWTCSGGVLLAQRNA